MPNNTIILKGDIGRRYEEGRVKTAKAITPGMVIELLADSTLQPHSVLGDQAEILVAIEDALNGGTIDTVYAAGDLVRYNSLADGDSFQAILLDGQSADPSKWWTSNGDGKVRVGVPGTDFLYGKFLETLAPSGADARVKVRVNKAAQS